MHFRDDKLKTPRIKHWSQAEYDECVRRGFLDASTTILQEGSLHCFSRDGEKLPKRWTKAEYNEKVELGFLCKQRVFLYRGELIEMPVMSYLHARSCQKIMYWLFDQFRKEGFDIRIRAPIEVPGESMPEPDGALVTPVQAKHFPHPNGAVLVIEVTEQSSQMEDERAFDYAAAKIPEYWIVNPRARTTELFREPISDKTSGTGFRYASRSVLGETESFRPLCKPSGAVLVANLMLNA